MSIQGDLKDQGVIVSWRLLTAQLVVFVLWVAALAVIV